MMKKIIGLILSLTLLFAMTVPTADASVPERIRVACVGDSITEGDTTTNKSATAYPAQLQTFLGNEYWVKNFGASGHAALKDVGYVQSYWKNSKYADSLAFEPNIVIIMLGTNDVIDPKYTDEVYTADMKALIDSYKALSTNPEIYIATAPCCYASEDNNRAERIQTILLPLQKQIAEDNGCKIVDINAMTQNMSDLYTDGLHPNDAGYLKLAQFMYEGVFDKTAAEVTVKAKPGYTVCLGGQQVAADENGNTSFITGDGEKTFTITRAGEGFAYIKAVINGNTEINCENIALPDNIALNAAITDASGAVTTANDADSSTGWQRSDGINNAWLMLDLKGTAKVNSVVIEWDGSNRAHHEDGYYLEYSSDGSTWTRIDYTNSRFSYGMDIDTVTFDKVGMAYLRIKVESSMKGNAKINEVGVFNSVTNVYTPEAKYENASDSTSLEADGGSNGGVNPILFVGIGAAVLVIAAAAVLVAVKKKKA